MQTVFKIDLPRNSEQAQQRPFIPRRVHKKSREGCLECKKRRIKCDEARPRCGKCVKSNGECTFPPALGPSPKTLFTDERSLVPLTGDMYTLGVESAETELNDLLNLTSGLDLSCLSTGVVRTLHHFQNFTSLTLGGDACRTIFHSVISKKAWDLNNPYLMHMVLGVSSAHLKRLHHNPLQIRTYQQYSVSEAAHWQTGLQLYQKLLQNRQTNGAAVRADFDATLATTFLIIIFTFALDDEIPVDAYIAEDEEKFRHAINPLAATAGFRALSDIFGGRMNDSCWRQVLIGSDDEIGTFSNSEQSGTEGLPAALVDLCELDESSDTDNNKYYHIVRLLTPLLRLDHSLDNFTKLIAFSGRTWPNFRPLLLTRDPRGLLLLSYWFALLRQLNQWWLTQRARTECKAIVNYLSQLEDPKIIALLPFPASFGECDLASLWEPPVVSSDSAAAFERYFSKAGTFALRSER